MSLFWCMCQSPATHCQYLQQMTSVATCSKGVTRYEVINDMLSLPVSIGVQHAGSQQWTFCNIHLCPSCNEPPTIELCSLSHGFISFPCSSSRLCASWVTGCSFMHFPSAVFLVAKYCMFSVRNPPTRSTTSRSCMMTSRERVSQKTAVKRTTLVKSRNAERLVSWSTWKCWNSLEVVPSRSHRLWWSLRNLTKVGCC